jgi:two-component system sensor histidine kinase PilS (NtrC family)
MYASGGISSGLGTLMLVTVAASGILVSGKTSFAFAALATLSILSMHSYSFLIETDYTSYGFTHIGLLGAGLFAVALLTHTLAIRIKESEALAKQRGSQLADLSQINELIIQQMDTGILVIANNDQILLQNDAALNILDIQNDITGQLLSSLSPKLYMQYLSWQENTNTEIPPLRIEKSSNEVLPRFSRIGKIENIATAVFLEDTAQLAQQTQQIKLASLGRLTASIAHEIRNPLSAINHAAQLLAESDNFDKQDVRLTEIISSQTNRLNTIVESILSLSRKDEYARESINTGPWLESFIKKYYAEKPHVSGDITVNFKLCDRAIQFDPTHLGQILGNLCDNALNYATSSGPGTPLVSLSCNINQPQKLMEIEVHNTGPNIDNKTLERLFEPFFTTSPKGTGLGLFIARELSELNKAHLNHVRTDRPGVSFRLSIPIAEN